MYHITWITNVQGAQSRASEDLSGVVSGESPCEMVQDTLIMLSS
jgi:hypothetical protein